MGTTEPVDSAGGYTQTPCWQCSSFPKFLDPTAAGLVLGSLQFSETRVGCACNVVYISDWLCGYRGAGARVVGASSGHGPSGL